MLQTLSISNFLLVHKSTLSLQQGICVLTGETGAGKSILINALSLVLGSRGSNSWVRKGCKQATIAAQFSHIPEALHHILKTLSISYNEDQLHLRRILFADGKTKAFINDTPVTIKTLQSIGIHLVDIYGQHSHYALLKPEIQREKLDHSGDYQTELDKLQQHFEQWQALNKQHKDLIENSQNNQDRQNLIAYQLEEFEQLSLSENEFSELEQAQTQLSQADQVSQVTGQAVSSLYEEDQSVISVIESQQQQLESFSQSFPALQGVCETLNEACVQLHEAVDTLKSTSVSSDPEQLAYTEARLGALFDLSRKHQCQPQALLKIQQDLQTEFDAIHSDSSTLETLEKSIATHWKQLEKLSGTLSQKRKKAAEHLSKVVTEQIQHLGMSGAQFHIGLSPLDDGKMTRYGRDHIQYELESNPGLGFNPLNRSASGGELSRLGLAVQVCTMTGPNIPTIIMDEVDAGIGGETANKVGALLKKLATQSQVLCVTHLPQIANIGNQHIKVEKHLEDGLMQHIITPLEDTQRIAEIARMLDGDNPTEQSLEHAKAMLQKSA